MEVLNIPLHPTLCPTLPSLNLLKYFSPLLLFPPSYHIYSIIPLH